MGGVGGGGGRGIPEAFPQMQSCRAGLREHKEFVKSAAAAPFTLKIKKSEERLATVTGEEEKDEDKSQLN